jgi:hypothetical protein
MKTNLKQNVTSPQPRNPRMARGRAAFTLAMCRIWPWSNIISDVPAGAHPPCSPVQGKSEVNRPQMLLYRGRMRTGVDKRNHPLAPGLPQGRTLKRKPYQSPAPKPAHGARTRCVHASRVQNLTMVTYHLKQCIN